MTATETIKPVAAPLTTAQLQDRIKEMAAKSIASRREWLACGRTETK